MQSICRTVLKSSNQLSRLSRNMSGTSAMYSKFKMADRLDGTDKNVWVEFASLATQHKALNLGQGFPDFMPPSVITDSLKQMLVSETPSHHQYTRSYGHMRMVNALAQTYGKVLGREIDAQSEVLVTVGAYGSLFCAVQGLINPGDEDHTNLSEYTWRQAIIIEPFFDCYEPMVRVAGGKPSFIPLRPKVNSGGGNMTSADWKLDPVELESKFNDKTKLLFLNNPNNPLGKVYDMEELQMIADLCKKYNVVVVSDEVYEWMIYKPSQHIKIASLPGMWERTITIGSAGKAFSATGWKLGWAIGPKQIIHSMQCMHQNSTYTCPTALQEVVAMALEFEFKRFDTNQCYYKELPAELMPKRDNLFKYIQLAGLKPILPDGGYFMVADISDKNIELNEDEGESKDYKFVKHLIRHKKLATIPVSAFYNKENKHLAKNLIRFCFIKNDSTLESARDILKTL